MSRLAGLRPRITLLIASLVALCLLAAFVAVYRGTASRLEGDTDRALRHDMRLVTQAVPGDTPGEVVAQARRFVAGRPFRPTTNVVFVVAPGRGPVTNEPELLDPTRRDREDSAAEQRAEARAAAAVLTAPAGTSRRTLPGVGPVRLRVRVRQTAQGAVRYGVGEPLEPVERAEVIVGKAFLLAGVLGMAGAFFGGGLVATRVAAPLRRMARVAARVDAGDLSPRMELGGRHDEVRVLAHSFDQMLDRLQDAFDRQTAFVADASHELRTPLTIARGQLEVLAMEDAPSAEQVRRVETVVLTEIDRMSRLVEDLLLLARADEPGFLRLEPVDLPELLGELVDGLRATVPDRRLELSPVPPLVIEADPDRLAQALRNLLTNATVHTEPGGRVRLEAVQVRGRLRLAVDDDGPGVPASERRRVFDRFARTDAARARDAGGAGLGLAIVRAIAEAHGGSVWVDDAPMGGARFVLELPLEGGENRAAAT